MRTDPHGAGGSSGLAKRTGCNPRLVREWLNAQAAAGYVEYADVRSRLPAEQALAQAVEGSPVYVAGGATVLASLFLDKDKQVAAMLGNGAIPWGDHPLDVSGVEKFFRPGYKANLVSTWTGPRGRRREARSGREGR